MRDPNPTPIFQALGEKYPENGIRVLIQIQDEKQLREGFKALKISINAIFEKRKLELV